MSQTPVLAYDKERHTVAKAVLVAIKVARSAFISASMNTALNATERARLELLKQATSRFIRDLQARLDDEEAAREESGK